MEQAHTNQSQQLFTEAKRWIPGGVNSPVRSFYGVGGEPLFFDSAKGAYLFDEDGQAYLDYVGSWGPMILGHQDPIVVEAVQSAAMKGMSFGAPTRLEVEMAKKVCKKLPHIEMIRMVNSGTEATMTAIRLARGYTKRDILIKFTGCYHGHSDSLLIQAGSGPLTLGQPNSAGVPIAVAQNTLTLPFNDIEALGAAFNKYNNQIAAVIIEPVAGNMGCIPATSEFIRSLREQCTQNGSILIFDEVMTGFRIHEFGAAGFYDIEADLTTFGKIIGGGLPVGAIGGKREIMSYLAPLGPVYQAGTLSGNPLAMAAGLATLNRIENIPNFYQQLKNKTKLLAVGLKEQASKKGLPLQINFVPGMLSLFFTEKPVLNLEDVKRSNTELFKKYFHGMLQMGIYLPPSAYEAWFISIQHSDVEINKTLEASSKVLNSL